ncbi:M43 family zinc metalloprotease [Hymenobacter terrenus]|uniref:M43 family zinc metalloprotease n=1 Tax=Hymenobacter terrenus TaxID=1629124 RepID=UPI000A82F738|nr:M43 family zinc metalloprotease [Hymenobacter terrenus]
MLKNFYSSLLIAALTLTALGANAQGQLDKGNREWCGTTAERERYFTAHPGARAAEQALYQRLKAMPSLEQRGPAAAPDVTIPVVVHIIHAGRADNISDQQVDRAIGQLNADFQKLNTDASQTIPLFQPIAASVGFQFRLAKKDPNGNCTTGITRHYAPTLVHDDLSGTVQALSTWDPVRYLNIWVVSTIGPFDALAGYVAPPVNPTNPRDGFTIRNDRFDDQNTINPSLSQPRTSTHEIGHYFGLQHTWGPNNNPEVPGYCGDTDNVADTPATNGTFTCNLAYAPCGAIANVQNYMDYSGCPTMFTEGQKTLMRNVLTAVRPVLVSQANLVATGTNDGYVAPGCAPIAAFFLAPGSSDNVCVNTPVTLRDYSSNFTAAGGVLTHAWSFPGGTPATATGPTATVAYATAGFYTVTETVSNSFGSSSATTTIRVDGPTGGETAPFRQSFEDPNFPDLFPAPTLRNYELSGETISGPAPFRWQRQTTFPAADGSAYLVVNNRLQPATVITRLITPNINLADLTGPAVLSFARAYALRTAASDGRLRISFSNDCGINWSSPLILRAAALSTQGLTPIDGYTPTAPSDWQTLIVPIPALYQGSSIFKVRVEMFSGFTSDNDFFLDDLRVTSPVATTTTALTRHGISVYPNPLTNETAVHLNLTATTQVRVHLTDMLGREVLALPAKTYGVGAQTLPLPTAGQPLKAGVYVMHIGLNGEIFTSKLTVR